MKVLHSTYHQIWKILPWPQDWKRSVFTPIAKKGNYRELCNYCTVAFISHATKLMLKILQAMPQQYSNHKLLHSQVGFRKGRGTKIKLPTSAGSLKNEESSRRSTSALLRFLLCGLQQTLGISERDVNTRPPNLNLYKPVCRSESSSYWWK